MFSFTSLTASLAQGNGPSISSILILVLGLVVAVVALAIIAPRLHIPYSILLVLGAIVPPTDAVAATAIAQRLGIPQRIVTILEGESLVNDATGLVAYRFALAAVVTGVFSLGEAGLQFVVVSVGGSPLAWWQAG